MNTPAVTRLSIMVRAQSPRAPLQAFVRVDLSAEGVTKTQLVAIRFGTPENAALFKARALLHRGAFVCCLLTRSCAGTFRQGPKIKREARGRRIRRRLCRCQPRINSLQRGSKGGRFSVSKLRYCIGFIMQIMPCKTKIPVDSGVYCR